MIFSRHFAVAAIAVIACLGALALEAQQATPSEPLAITTASLPDAIPHTNYYHQLGAHGGTPPLRWSLEKGSLPPGLTLDVDSGVLAGLPTALGSFAFTVKVTDSGRPQQSQSREYSLAVLPALTVQWKRAPELSAGGIYGSVELVSHMPDQSDLTFIVVAVNAIGKAFVLGYQHMNLAPGAENQQLPFGSTLPAGAYIVHVDAIAEIASSNSIYRARLVSAGPLIIP